MYVRWHRRERTKRVRAAKGKGSQGTDEYVLTAILVKSERVSGQPRQRIVGYLGTIRESQLPFVLTRADFWAKVNARLDALALDRDTRESVESIVARRVPIPGKAEVAQVTAEVAQARADLERFPRRIPARHRRA